MNSSRPPLPGRYVLCAVLVCLFAGLVLRDGGRRQLAGPAEQTALRFLAVTTESRVEILDVGPSDDAGEAALYDRAERRGVRLTPLQAGLAVAVRHGRKIPAVVRVRYRVGEKERDELILVQEEEIFVGRTANPDGGEWLDRLRAQGAAK